MRPHINTQTEQSTIILPLFWYATNITNGSGACPGGGIGGSGGLKVWEEVIAEPELDAYALTKHLATA